MDADLLMKALLFLLLLPGAHPLYEQGEALEAAGRYPEAESSYLRFAEANPGDPLRPGALLAVAWIRLRAGRAEAAREALAPLEALTEVERARFENFFIFTRAEIERALGEEASADADYRAVLRSNDTGLLPAARFGLALVLAERGGYAEAEALLTAYLEGSGARRSEALFARAQNRSSLRRLPEAVEDYRAFGAMAGNGETGAREAALLLSRSGDPSGPSALTEYLRIYPQGTGATLAHQELFSFARDRGDTRTAIPHARFIIEAAPRSFAAIEAHLFLFHALPWERQTHAEAIRSLAPESSEAEEIAMYLARDRPARALLAPPRDEAGPGVIRLYLPPVRSLTGREEVGELALRLRTLLGEALESENIRLALPRSARLRAALDQGSAERISPVLAGLDAACRIRLSTQGNRLVVHLETRILPEAEPVRRVVTFPRAAADEEIVAGIARALAGILGGRAGLKFGEFEADRAMEGGPQ